jgi:hypothetical protein
MGLFNDISAKMQNREDSVAISWRVWKPARPRHARIPVVRLRETQDTLIMSFGRCWCIQLEKRDQ